MPEGLTGKWAVEHSTWRERFDGFFSDIDRTPVTILVWGPGENRPGWEKRKRVIDHLRQQSEYNNVCTSEELMRSDTRFRGMHLYDAELIHWVAANVVIAIVPKDFKVTGVRQETGIYRGYRQFREKTYVVAPRLPKKGRRSMPFMEYGWSSFPKQRRFSYTDDEFEDCTKIRAFCEGIVRELRRELGLASLQRSLI